MNVRRIFVSSLVVIAVAAAGAYLFRTPLSLALAKKVALSRLAADAVQELPDGLHVGLCGAGSPFPDDRRSGPCTLVLAGKRLFIFDAGSGASRNIGKMGFNQGTIDAIFLSHFHSDHIDGLGELMLQRWIGASNRQPVTLYGPGGVEQVVAGFSQAYQQDQHYRVAHHGDAFVPASGFGGKAQAFALEAGRSTLVLKDGTLEIRAFEVDHAPVHPAVGYRIDYQGRSVVLSGDTKKSAQVQAAAQGVDLLVHEALSPPMVRLLQDTASTVGRPHLQKIFGDIVDYHATPEQAAETARDAKVGYLLLNHIVPTLPPLPGMEQVFLGEAARIFAGPIKVGLDGDFVSLPANSKAISVGRRF